MKTIIEETVAYMMGGLERISRDEIVRTSNDLFHLIALQ